MCHHRPFLGYCKGNHSLRNWQVICDFFFIMQRFWHISSSGSGAQYPDEGTWWVASVMSTRRRDVRERSEVQGLYIYCNMGQPKRRDNTLLPLQGVKSPVILGYPGCRFACPGLSTRWAFSPLYLITPRTWFSCQTGHLKKIANSPILDKLFMTIAGYSWQLLTTSASACGPIQSTDAKQIWNRWKSV